MLSKLEKIGLLSILKTQLQQAEETEARHYANSQMEDQSQVYRNNQYAEHKYYAGLATGFRKAINEIKDIPVK